MEDVDLPSASGLCDLQAGDWLARFAEVDRVISRNTDEPLNRLFGISTAQARTIACLAHQAFLTQAQLAHRLHYDFASVSRLISRLVAARIAVKNRCADDRRCWCISLTERGACLVPDIAAVLRAVDGRSTSNLTDDEEHFFLALLRRLLANAVSHTAEITTGVAGVADQVGEWPAAPDFYNAGCAVGW